VLESVTQAALSSALDGLALRQRTIANNIANVNTPDYHAKRVLFEDALAQSVKNGDGHVDATVARSLEPTELTEFVKERIGSVKAPKQVEVWDDLPRSKVGKVLKTEVRKVLLDA
jgi:flagellar basal-body rod protein FlgB